MKLFKNCKIVDVINEKIIHSDILINEGKIIEISENIEREDAYVEDMQGNYVMPGFIDITTEVGLVESGRRFEGNDANEQYSNVLCGMKTVNGIYIWDASFQDAYENGVTTVVVSSGNKSVLGAQSCIMKTKLNSVENMTINDSIDIKATIGDAPKKGNVGRQETPMSRMGINHLLRSTLEKARAYKEDESIKPQEINLDYRALKRVLNKEIPLKVEAHKAQDILSAISIKKDFDIDLIIDCGTEAYMVKEELRKNNVPVVLSSIVRDVTHKELKNINLNSAKELMDEGVLVAISTNHPETDIQLLPLSMKIASGNRINEYEAIKLITINPAKMVKMDNQIGSIEVGKDADMVVVDNFPLNDLSGLVATIVEGEVLYRA